MEIITDEVLAEVEHFLDAMKSEIAQNITTTGRKASGRTAKSLQVEMTPIGGRIVGRQYFQGLEIGRPKGKVPYKFHNIIRQWMQDKGIEGNFDNPASASWLIARKIRERGTNMWYKHEYNVYTPVIDTYESRMRDAIMGIVTKNLSKEIKKQFGNG